MKIKTILVDDEPWALQRMKDLLAEHEDVEIVAECTTGQQARTVIEQLKPDLMLLDVQMPRMTGIKLVKLLEDTELPLIVFVSAHEGFAVEAFDTRAVDYLLKPVRAERLSRSLERVRDQLAAIRDGPVAQEIPEPPGEPRRISRLMAKTNDRVVFIKNEQIDWIESAGNYVIVQAGQERHIIRETMVSLERGLPPADFVRLNRSLIVNVGRIVELKANGQGNYHAVLQGGKKINVTVGLRELEQKLRFAP
jgi:two-component system, LytTR family, response regulator